jgi:hypothetical protein
LRSHVEGTSQEVVLRHGLCFHNRETPDTRNTTIDRLRDDIATFVIFGQLDACPVNRVQDKTRRRIFRKNGLQNSQAKTVDRRGIGQG